jgi:site-specific recombinase XerD
LRLNPPAHALVPGNRKALPRDSNAVDRHSGYPRVQLQLILDRFEVYLDHHALSPATVRNYVADLRAFTRWQLTHKAHPQALTPSDFRAYREHLCNETDQSPATVNRRLQSLRLFGRFLHEMGHVADNPTREIQLLRNGNGHPPAPRTLTQVESNRLVDSLHTGRPSLALRDHAIMQLMLQAGLRIHEVAALRLGDLVATRGGMSIHVHGNGRGSPRSVPLNSTAARALRNYMPTRAAIPRVDHLFLSQRSQALSMRSIQRLIDAHARAAGLKGVCAQSLRHTCAKNMLEETRDAARVARWLGCNAKSLERYSA